MIITDIKEIYKNVEVGDTLFAYDYEQATFDNEQYEEMLICDEVVRISRCKYTGCGWGCSNLIHLKNHEIVCFQYGHKICSIKCLIKKEGFISEEEMTI